MDTRQRFSIMYVEVLFEIAAEDLQQTLEEIYEEILRILLLRLRFQL
ncbi:unannotated protein [freshwater metagenome]|uniref:Unannotated protein n=1 Tax=freshwater metagenome TaxID=449393 RepID=A0A6J6F9U8_9ZZZZ